MKTLAEYLDLSPATVSFVLNDAPNRSIPETTRVRVREAAKKFNYQPSLIARSLQGKRTQTIGVLLPDVGDGYQAEVLSGAAGVLMRTGYFYFTALHAHRPELLEQYPRMLSARGVEGFLAIDTQLNAPLPWPTVAVSSRTQVEGVTNLVVDQDLAAELALGHLTDLGHQRIAFLRGQPFAAEAEARWHALQAAAQARGLVIDEGLVLQLESELHSPERSYPVMKTLLETRRDFTAVVCFDDLSAIGCLRALHEAGLRVPEDVSLVGFGDIDTASFHVPSLTTFRLPLKLMGQTAAEILLEKIAAKPSETVIQFKPELIVRESTGRART